MEATAGGVTLFWKILVLILLSAPPAQQGAQPPAGPALAQYIARPAPVYVEVDARALRGFIQKSEPLQDTVIRTITRHTLQAKPAADSNGTQEKPVLATPFRQQLLGEVAGALKTKPENLDAIAGSVQRAGVWLLELDEKGGDWRSLIVVERTSADPILPALFQPFQETPGIASSHLAGVPAYSLMVGPQRFWMAETGNKIALASDPLVLQVFLHNAAAPDDVRRAVPRPAPGTLVQVDVNAPALLANLDAWARQQQNQTFLAYAMLLDFASWTRLTANFDGQKVQAQLDYKPESALAGICNMPDAAPALLDTLPVANCLTLAVSLREPDNLWKQFCARSPQLSELAGEKNMSEGLREAFQKKTGLDIEQDLMLNLNAAALVIPKPVTRQNWGHGAVYVLEARDAERAKASLNKMMLYTKRDANVEPAIDLTTGEQVWQGPGFDMIFIAPYLFLAPTGSELLPKAAAYLKPDVNRQENPSLATAMSARFPEARWFLSAEPSLLVASSRMKPIRAGFMNKTGVLRLDADLDGTSLAIEWLASRFAIARPQPSLPRRPQEKTGTADDAATSATTGIQPQPAPMTVPVDPRMPMQADVPARPKGK
ncbi:MAG TPA: hypothetical protein PLA90_02735 [Candidatus Sumerlaeota bacterium]|nr:hypothetical protein [Candidatus Sumerlaeota bacterium]